MNALFGVYADVTERPAWQTLRTMTYVRDRGELSNRVNHHLGKIYEERAKARRGT